MLISNKTILVTGTSGFIGSALSAELYSRGAIVHGVSREKKCADQKINWWHGDLIDYTFVDKLFQSVNPDIVFHLASFVTGSRDINIVLPSYHSIATTTINILHATTLHKCKKVILAGSMEEPMCKSDITLTPGSPYGAAKFACTIYARMYHALYDTPIVIPRIFMVYGPNQKDRNKLIPYVIRSLLRGEKPKLSSGVRLVDWIYIDDVVQGLIKIAEGYNGYSEHIDIGSGKLVSIRDVVTNIASLMSCEDLIEFGELEDRPLETMNVADISNLQNKLSWKPDIEITEGLKKTIEWYSRQENSM
jgi:UDP-glucose 4-epimerase